jgi:hypothetical protein
MMVECWSNLFSFERKLRHFTFVQQHENIVHNIQIPASKQGPIPAVTHYAS